MEIHLPGVCPLSHTEVLIVRTTTEQQPSNGDQRNVLVSV